MLRGCLGRRKKTCIQRSITKFHATCSTAATRRNEITRPDLMHAPSSHLSCICLTQLLAPRLPISSTPSPRARSSTIHLSLQVSPSPRRLSLSLSYSLSLSLSLSYSLSPLTRPPSVFTSPSRSSRRGGGRRSRSRRGGRAGASTVVVADRSGSARRGTTPTSASTF